MAGNDDGDGIVMIRLPDGAKAVGIADRACDLRVGAVSPYGISQQFIPAALAELGAAQIQLELEVAPRAGEVFVQLLTDIYGFASRILPMRPVARRSLCGSPRSNSSDDQGSIRNPDQQRPDRRGHSRDNKVFP